MKNRVLIMAMLMLAMASIMGTSGASAATVIGDQCSANDSEEIPLTFFEFSAPGNPLQTTAPTNGVITRWGVNVIPFPGTLPLTLQAIRVVSANQLQVLGENSVSVIGGNNSFDTRIPVQAGDRIALQGPTELGILVCASGAEEVHLGAFAPTGPGSTTLFEQGNDNFRIPLTATIEPDADSDGFGDETQDACPQSPTTQVACPVVTLSSSATAGKKSVTLLLTGTTPANVTVNGKVSLGKGKKANLKGGTKGVVPGAFTKFKLKFPAKLIKRLKELPPSRKLTLKVTSTAPNVAAAPTKKTIKVKLKGQGPAS